jgi:hypothetical protein
MKLKTKPSNISGDGLFSLIIGAHEGLEEAESRQLDASLVLLLANHIGSKDVIAEAIYIAQNSLQMHK